MRAVVTAKSCFSGWDGLGLSFLMRLPLAGLSGIGFVPATRAATQNAHPAQPSCALRRRSFALV
jgi:hypothetical protein